MEVLEFGAAVSWDVVITAPRLIKVLYTIPWKILETLRPAGTSMNSKRCRRKPDLFSVLILVVALGVSVTVAYQVNVYYGGHPVPIARQASMAGSVGG